jgi:hypothetical protein
MKSANSTVNELIGKLEDFIRKYYQNKLLRGVLYSTGLLALFFLLISVIEYVGENGIVLRAVLFYSYLALSCFVLVFYILKPIFGLFRIGKSLSHEHAAELIGQHFNEVKDKLINTLQLQKQLDDNPGGKELILAGIDQKIRELKPVPFSKAIDFGKNKRYIPLALIPLLFILGVLLIKPAILTESTKRIISYDKTFEPVAPFQFFLVNSKLEVASMQDFNLEIHTKGEELPRELYIDISGNKFKCQSAGKTNFNYLFKNVKEDVRFRLYADGFFSKEYTLKSLPSPLLVQFTVSLDYPSYTGKKDEQLANIGDLSIPAGTEVKWNFKTEETSNLSLKFEQDVAQAQKSSAQDFSFSKRFLQDDQYSIEMKNSFMRNTNAVQYSVSVKADAYPLIEVDSQADSILGSDFVFKGKIEDDYGLTELKFNVLIPGQGNKPTSVDVPFNKNYSSTYFIWSSSFNAIQLEPGQELEYWFEVWDNDAVTGRKSTKSQKGVYRKPTLEELQEKSREQQSAIKADLKSTMDEAKKLQKELDELTNRMLEKKELTWQDKNKAKELIDRQKKLQEQLNEVQKDNKKNNERNKEFNKDEEILKKQEQIEKLLEELLSPEMKEQLRQLEDMLKMLDKDKLKEEMEKLQQDNKDIEKELDRSLELLKQLEVEQRIKDAIDKLDALQKEQDKLAEKTEKNQSGSEDLKAKQDSLNKEFNKLSDELDQVEKKNQELENPMPMDATEQMEQDIKQEMQQSSQDLNSKKNSKASKSQKNASSKMQQMKDKMQQSMNEAAEQSLEEDVSKIREILENLLQLSFDQEDLMKQLQRTPTSNPLYVKITADQKKIKDNAKAIEDSLFALSKRVEEISSFVNKEIGQINFSLDKSIEYLAERQSAQASSRQQFAMTSINNLALMLSEVSDQMQQQLAQQQQQQKEGNGSCKKPGNKKKPGNGKPSAGAMRQLQQQLNDQMEKMKSEMGKPGKGKDGKSGSQQLAKMAAQQEMLRNEMQKMLNEMMKEGDNGSAGNLRKMIEQMEKTETDLVNKNISSETMRRQQEIMTRLLEAEKAERERDQDEKRESNENKSEFNRNLLEFQQYMQQKNAENELLKTSSPELKPFYKNLVEQYFKTN